MRTALKLWPGLCVSSIMCAGLIPDVASGLPFGPTVSHRSSSKTAQDAADDDLQDTSFANLFGLEGAHEALTSGGASRLRQLYAFATADGTNAVQRQVAHELHRWLSDEPALTPDETLAVVRALAPLNRWELVRKHLTRMLTQKDAAPKPDVTSKQTSSESTSRRAAQLHELTARMAALALARSQAPDAVSELGQWLRRPSQEAEYAAQALILSPPSDLAPLLDAPGPVTPLLLRTLKSLRNPQSESFLRRVLKRASAPVQAEASLALLALGIEETRDLAQYWLNQADPGPELLWASTHILFHYRDPERKQALLRLVNSRPTLALEVASHYVDQELLVLGDFLKELPGTAERRQALTYLSRLEQLSVPLLVKSLTSTPEVAMTAAARLSRHSKPDAGLALMALLGSPVPHSQAPTDAMNTPEATAALVVLALTAASARGVADAAQAKTLFAARLDAAKGNELRAIKLGLAALDVNWAHRWLASADPSELALAARVVGLHGGQYKRAALERLGEFVAHPLDPRALALSPVLTAVRAKDTLPLALLQAWAQSSMPVAYPAVWQLCTRLPVQSRGPVGHWLASSDPEIRAAAYLGLGSNPAPHYTSALLSALQREVDPWARQALIAALSKRPPIPPIQRALQMEKAYNPNLDVQRLLRARATSLSNDFWFSAEVRTDAPHVEWVTITSAEYPPITASIEQNEPFLIFLPDDRPFDENTFHVRTHPTPPPSQASN